MSEHVFEVLRCGVRQPGERTERCNIGKILISELADVDLLGFPEIMFCAASSMSEDMPWQAAKSFVLPDGI